MFASPVILSANDTDWKSEVGGGWQKTEAGFSDSDFCPLTSGFRPLIASSSSLWLNGDVGAFVYRLGRGLLKAERRVRFPYALPKSQNVGDDVRSLISKF